MCGFKNASVCTFNTSPSPRAHGGQGGHRQFCLPKFAHVGLSRASDVHRRNPWIFPIFKFEKRSRTTCSRFLQSFALPDEAVQFQQFLTETLAGVSNQMVRLSLPFCSPLPPPARPSQQHTTHRDRDTHTQSTETERQRQRQRLEAKRPSVSVVRNNWPPVTHK